MSAMPSENEVVACNVWPLGHRRLVLSCSLWGVGDLDIVRGLLEEYGLSAEGSSVDLFAVGEVPQALAWMRDVDIEAHLTMRIEEAAPGARVAAIRATVVPRSLN